MTIKYKFKNFINESFRPHGKDEYAELFTRGTVDREGVNTVYPWAYLRVMAVLAAVYTIYAIINSMLPGAGNKETFYFVGGAFLDVALLVLAFELYPYKDFSLLTLLCVCIAGGAVSDFLSAFIYHFHSLDILLNGWKLAAIAGIGEEISKAIPTIFCILILKKKDTPIAGFLIGAAIGTWFSLSENASYIRNAYPMAQRVLTATARAFGAPFSHAMWSALIGWAFCKFKKPFLNLKFYGVVILCMALHFSIDMPLWDYIIILFAEAAVCGLIAFFFGITVIYKERKFAFPDEQLCIVQPPPLINTHVINISLSAFGVVLCALLLLLSAVFSPVSIKKTEYSVEEFTAFVQGGYNIQPDYERKLDEVAEINYLEQWELGELKYIQQMQTGEEINYLYCYRFNDRLRAPDGESEGGGFELVAVRVMIEIDGKERWFTSLPFEIGEEGELITLYIVNPEFQPDEFNYKDGKIIRNTEINVPTWQTIAAICASGAVAVSGAITYFVLKRKLR